MRPPAVLVADPPWKFGDKLPGKKRGAERNYKTLTLEQLKAFPVPVMADDAWLFLWRVGAMVEEAYQVLRAWDFEPTGGELVWLKTTGADEALAILDPDALRELKATGGSPEAVLEANGAPARLKELFAKPHFGMGRTVRNAHEVCIIGRRGRPRRAAANVRSVFVAPYAGHSVKPDRFYEIVERLTGGEGPYHELFARRRRPGWTCEGDEL